MQTIQKIIWTILALIVALWVSWHLLAQTNFMYSTWYHYGGMKQSIEQYAPQNKYRDGFETTTDEARLELFGGIVYAIQNNGAGLKDLSYKNVEKITPLLTQAEIYHLQDVGKLIHILNQACFFMLSIFALLSAWIKVSKQNFPKPKESFYAIGLGLTVAIASVLAYGAKDLFFQFHVWVFPDNHQWFFFYQDSLMSTMMKAPDLFAYITIVLLVVTILILSTAIYVFQKLNPKQLQSS